MLVDARACRLPRVSKGRRRIAKMLGNVGVEEWAGYVCVGVCRRRGCEGKGRMVGNRVLNLKFPESPNT